jgi:hypothetical protein
LSTNPTYCELVTPAYCVLTPSTCCMSETPTLCMSATPTYCISADPTYCGLATPTYYMLSHPTYCRVGEDCEDEEYYRAGLYIRYVISITTSIIANMTSSGYKISPTPLLFFSHQLSLGWIREIMMKNLLSR